MNKSNSDAVNLAREYADILRAKLGDRVKQVILFGSHARGEAGPGSDYDVLVIVDERTPHSRELVLDADVEMMDKHEKLFAAVIYGEREWQEAQDFPLAWNVNRDGVAL